MHCIKGVGLYLWTELQNARIKGEKLVLSKTTLLAASILKQWKRVAGKLTKYQHIA